MQKQTTGQSVLPRVLAMSLNRTVPRMWNRIYVKYRQIRKLHRFREAGGQTHLSTVRITYIQYRYGRGNRGICYEVVIG